MKMTCHSLSIVLPILLGATLLQAQEVPDSLVIAEPVESPAYLEPSSREKGKADGQIWIWENAEEIEVPLSISFTLPINPELLSAPKLKRFEFKPESSYQFNRHSEYLKSESEELLLPAEIVQRRRSVIPISKIASLLSSFGGKDKKKTADDVPRGLVLSETELDMLNIVWKKPDISPVDWYMACSTDGEFPGTYTTFQQILDGFIARGLVKKRVITLGFFDRFKDREERYTAIFTSKILKMAFADAFATSDALSKGAYHFQLQRMLTYMDQSEDQFNSINSSQ